LHLHYKNNYLEVFRKIIAIYSCFRMKHINAYFGQNTDLINVKKGLYNNHYAFECYNASNLRISLLIVGCHHSSLYVLTQFSKLQMER
jgi:hypothetical protein